VDLKVTIATLKIAIFEDANFAATKSPNFGDLNVPVSGLYFQWPLFSVASILGPSLLALGEGEARRAVPPRRCSGHLARTAALGLRPVVDPSAFGYIPGAGGGYRGPEPAARLVAPPHV
jgi:hypothetical protein